MENNCKTMDIKILFLGPCGVGKSSIVKRFAENKYDDKYIPKDLIETHKKQLKINDFIMNLLILDPSGNLKSKIKEHYKSVDIFIFVFDLTRNETFESLKDYIYDTKICNSIKILLGNKSDLESNQNTKQNDINLQIGKITKDFEMRYLETSAKQTSISDYLQMVLEEYLYNISNLNYQSSELSSEKICSKYDEKNSMQIIYRSEKINTINEIEKIMEKIYPKEVKKFSENLERFYKKYVILKQKFSTYSEFINILDESNIICLLVNNYKKNNFSNDKNANGDLFFNKMILLESELLVTLYDYKIDYLKAVIGIDNETNEKRSKRIKLLFESEELSLENMRNRRKKLLLEIFHPDKFNYLLLDLQLFTEFKSIV